MKPLRGGKPRGLMKLAMMLKNMNECEKPVIGLVDGATMGGGWPSFLWGLCCGTKDLFALSEVKLEYAAVISPFVTSK